MESNYVWLDGRWWRSSEASCDPLSHALHYGTGVFEGIRSYATPEGPALFRLSDHLARFSAGARVLGMEIDLEALGAACLGVVARNDLADAYIRPIAFRGAGNLGLDADEIPTRIAVAAMRWSSHLGCQATMRGIRMMVTGVHRSSARAIPPLKLTGAYVNSVLAKREAARSGFEEALFVDDAGRVCEATGENVICVLGGRPVAVRHPDALPGVTRATVIELLGAEEREVALGELLEAGEVFVTGTSAEVTPVTAINGTRFQIGPVTREAQRLYGRAVRGNAPARWLTPVPKEAHLHV